MDFLPQRVRQREKKKKGNRQTKFSIPKELWKLVEIDGRHASQADKFQYFTVNLESEKAFGVWDYFAYMECWVTWYDKGNQ